MLSRYDTVQKKTVHVSVNSVRELPLSEHDYLVCLCPHLHLTLGDQCLRPLCSVDGWAVTTIEGIGGCVVLRLPDAGMHMLNEERLCSRDPTHAYAPAQEEGRLQPRAAVASAAQRHTVRLLQPRHGHDHLQVRKDLSAGVFFVCFCCCCFR
jgi:hypothetical protein